jgi:signal transduction histidine kinase
MNVVMTVALCLPVIFMRGAFVTTVLVLALIIMMGSPVGALSVSDLLLMAVAPFSVAFGIRLHRERARRQLAEERAQLAREVHDSVGHHLTAIKMQAAAAQRVPEAADRALGTIAELSSTALAEVRDFVCELRTDIDELATRLSGPGCRITAHGTAIDMPPVVAHTAYRIVQEALTNAIRHANATAVDIQLRRGRGRVVVTVTDNGCGPTDFVVGNGIRGIRERVAALSGTVHIGPHGRGWEVEAVLPT